MVRHRRFSNVWFSNPRAAGKISGTDVEHEWAYSNREMRRFLDKYVGCDTALKKIRIVTPSVCHCIFASETTCSGIGNTEHVCARSPCVLICCVQARGLRRADELAVPDNGVRQRQLLPRRRRRHSRLMRSDGDRPERLVSNAAGRHERELLYCDSNSVKKS